MSFIQLANPETGRATAWPTGLGKAEALIVAEADNPFQPRTELRKRWMR
jgi:hypothetical protein